MLVWDGEVLAQRWQEEFGRGGQSQPTPSDRERVRQQMKRIQYNTSHHLLSHGKEPFIVLTLDCLSAAYPGMQILLTCTYRITNLLLV